MHQLVRPDRVRDAVEHGTPSAVDDDLAAAAQPQAGAGVVDVLVRVFGARDLGRDLVGRRFLVDLDQELGGAVEAAQAYPVGAKTNGGSLRTGCRSSHLVSTDGVS
jgi:hypothetical protein